MNKLTLPCYGMVIHHGDDIACASITSDLKSDYNDPMANTINGIESMVLSLFCAGVDIASPAIIEAIETSVEAAGNIAGSTSHEATPGGECCHITKQRRINAIVNEEVTYSVASSAWEAALELNNACPELAIEQLRASCDATTVDYVNEVVEVNCELSCSVALD
ncbi:hypothetical protein [Pseudoalteromonas nigrifaciens]|uniref:hypothetical protein n=1 Tax=Pseudoalteromonas nigrifaciens TaxID=28109 RepID=UPI003FD5B771